MQSRKKLWAGRILSVLPAVFLLVSSINLALVQSPGVREAFARFGYPQSAIPVIGVLEFVCAALCLIPRTSLVGAILLTGYLAGAIATRHARVRALRTRADGKNRASAPLDVATSEGVVV